MKYKEPSPEEYLHIAEKVRSGEYFREAKRMYDVSVNNPMAERYFYVFITTIALLIFFTAFYAMQSLYPLSRTVPFIYALNDVLEDMPSIAPLKSHYSQSNDEAVLFFRAKVFVDHFENYDINRLERNYSGVEHDASPEVFARYQLLLQRSNPESPVLKYQRHSTRSVNILSVTKPDEEKNVLEVVFQAVVRRGADVSATLHKAVMEYDYSGVEFDPKTDTVAPVIFKVTSYKSSLISG